MASAYFEFGCSGALAHVFSGSRLRFSGNDHPPALACGTVNKPILPGEDIKPLLTKLAVDGFEWYLVVHL